MKVLLLASVLLWQTLALEKVTYNGSIKYFIADLAPSFPCHNLYEYGMTWFNMSTDESNWNAIATILNALSTAGFNGVRLPMFPESEKVTGENPDFDPINITWNQCN